MILPKVHLRKPCYDFYFLQIAGLASLSALCRSGETATAPAVRETQQTIQSVVATGGVYKGQGRNQRELMTRAYWEFLVHGE